MMTDEARPIEKLLASETLMEQIFDELWCFEYSNVDNKLNDVIQTFKKYSNTCQAFKINTKKLLDRMFGHVTIRNLMHHRRKFWSEIEVQNENFEDRAVLLNEFRVDFEQIPSLLRTMVRELGVNIQSAEIFPIDFDTIGSPSQNLIQLLMPLTTVRHAVEDLILETSTPKSKVPINIIVDTLSDLPDLDYVEKITLASTFLEYTADNLDYSLKDNRYGFFTYIQSLYKNLRCEELTMIMCDCINAYDKSLVIDERMTVPTFFPMELLRITLQALKPSILSLKLRTEATASFDEAYRMDWDEQEVFTNAVFLNSENYSNIENTSLADPEGTDRMLDTVLVVDTTDAYTWDLVGYKGFWATAKDFLLLFPMKKMVFGIRVDLYPQKSVIDQVQHTLDLILDAFWMYTLYSQKRDFYVQIHFGSMKGPILSRRILRKAVPRENCGHPLRVQYNEPARINFFETYGSRLSTRFSVQSEEPLYVSIYDDYNEVAMHFKLVDIEGCHEDED